MSVGGKYECLTKTPMGDQTAVLTVNIDGDQFTGDNVGTMGSDVVVDGRVDGNRLTWKFNLTSPLPITLECEATVDGDTISGSYTAPGFGAFPMTGKRTT